MLVLTVDDGLEVREGPADTGQPGAGAGGGGGLGPGGLTAAQELHDGEVQGEEVLECVQSERRGSRVETPVDWVSRSVQSQPPVHLTVRPLVTSSTLPSLLLPGRV